MGVPQQLDGLEWKIPLKWMIWGYPYLSKSPCVPWFADSKWDDPPFCHQPMAPQSDRKCLADLASGLQGAIWSWEYLYSLLNQKPVGATIRVSQPYDSH